ncbi:MAG: phenylalanine--tRNA ligase beta subunit-related protein [Candidatus Bathyarchaeota archaeon]|nr:phenylalanine--tRNA ligase beta subunit-related protein [Candidatus Bathyarchaeota archaeon]
MSLKIDSKLKTRFPDLTVLTLRIKGVQIQKRGAELEKFKVEVMRQVRNEYNLDSVKDHPTFRAYRDFFWSIKIDPTKIRPAAEALIRRILAGKTLPCINTLVDAYNLASIKSRIALATFDADKLEGTLLMRFAEEGEQFYGIGMEKPLILKGGEIVVSDEEKLVAIYPYRDADNTKVTEETENIMMLFCGVPGIPKENLENASRVALEYITRFCDGEKGI